MMLRTAWIALLALGLTACAGDRPAGNIQQATSSTTSSTSTVTANPATTATTLPTTTATSADSVNAMKCDDEPGGPLDVAGEPDWRRHGDYVEWTDTDGCLVRIDVLAERSGPEHCGWETTRVVIIGNPLGSTYFDSESDVEFVFDPDGVYGIPELVQGLQFLDRLPEDSVDTGFRQGERQLWVSPGDPGAIYLRVGTDVERWPEGTVPGCM